MLSCELNAQETETSPTEQVAVVAQMTAANPDKPGEAAGTQPAPAPAARIYRTAPKQRGEALSRHHPVEWLDVEKTQWLGRLDAVREQRGVALVVSASGPSGGGHLAGWRAQLPLLGFQTWFLYRDTPLDAAFLSQVRQRMGEGPVAVITDAVHCENLARLIDDNERWMGLSCLNPRLAQSLLRTPSPLNEPAIDVLVLLEQPLRWPELLPRSDNVEVQQLPASLPWSSESMLLRRFVGWARRQSQPSDVTQPVAKD